MENTANNANHFCFFTDANETHEMHTKSDNIAIMTHPALRR